MGFLTTITIKNDRLHHFKADPAGFAKLVFDGIDEANLDHEPVNLCGGYLTIQPSRHADDQTLYIHRGNTLTDLNPYGARLSYLIKEHPEWAAEILKDAEELLKDAKRQLKARVKT